MKCQSLFSVRNKNNITNLSSAQLAQRGVKVEAFTQLTLKSQADFVVDDILKC